jgi:hypothetical protein
MLSIVDKTGCTVVEWTLGKKANLPDNVDAIDVDAICAEGAELEFLTTIISGLTYPKNYSTVWWFGTQAKTIAGILDTYEGLASESSAFAGKKARIAGVRERVGSVLGAVTSSFSE